MLCSPEDAIAWVRSVEWLLYANRAVLLHLDDETRLSCIATGQGRLQWLGPVTCDAWAVDALECQAAAVLAVDLRPKLTPKSPSTIDARRHRQLWQRLAPYGVALLDTIIVTPDAGVSVTGMAAYPSGTEPSWLRVHSPLRRQGSGMVPTHENASSLPANAAPSGDVRKRLWVVPE